MPSQESREFRDFRCLGAACEDTCCTGWQVGVDEKTYEKYRQTAHPVLGPQLAQWIQISPEKQTGAGFAQIKLTGASCPFLSEQLCSIQKELGEEYLSPTCATFPRVIRQAGDVVERSLDPACPEAARLMLSDSRPASFLEFPERSAVSDDPLPPHYWEIRSTILRLLQNRQYTVAQRLLLVGLACDQLDTLPPDQTPAFLDALLYGVSAGLYTAHLQSVTASAPDQLALVLELMVARIKLDYTAQRYLDLYTELVEGLQLRAGEPLTESGTRYAEAHANQYHAFMRDHAYMLEHYVLQYAYRNVFPFGRKQLSTTHPFAAQYAVMTTYFAVIRTLLIGLAAKYNGEFGAQHVIRAVQSVSRTMEHCMAYPAKLLEILAGKHHHTAASLWTLVQDPSLPQG